MSEYSMGMFDQSKAFKFAEIGDSITGTIESWTEQQQMEYDRKTNTRTNTPATYDDGNPVMELRVTLVETGLQDATEQDDGRRDVYVSSTRAKKAFVAAVRGAGGKAPENGARVTVTYVGKDPDSFDGRAKAFSVAYERPVQASQTFGTGAPAQAAAAPAQTPQAPEQQPVQAAPAAAPAQPAAAPAAKPAESSPNGDKIRELIGFGLDDTTIANALGVSVEGVAAVRGAVA